MANQPTPEKFVQALGLDKMTHGMTWGLKALAAHKQHGVTCSLAEWGEGMTKEHLPGRTWRNPTVCVGMTTYREMIVSLGLATHIKDGAASDWLDELFGVFGVPPIKDLSAPVSPDVPGKLKLVTVLPEEKAESLPTDVTPQDEVGLAFAIALHLKQPSTKTSGSQPSGSGEKPASGCFVATAVFESTSAPEVLALRRWRDSALLPHWPGRLFVTVYYRLGPCLARFLKMWPALVRMTRWLLRGFVRQLEPPSCTTSCGNKADSARALVSNP